MKYGDVKTHVLRLLDEFSSSGNVQTTQDVLVKIMELSNDAMMDLASTTAKIPAVQYITINPVLNELSRDTSSMKKHLPGTDFTTELVGAKSCYFEVDSPATVLIQELNNGVWTTLETVTAIVSRMTEFKRLITPSVATNNVRLVFTGSYPYNFRNYVLYPYTWQTQDEVQQFRPMFEFDFNTDFLKFDRALIKQDQRQFIPMTGNYLLLPNKRIAINKYIAPAEVMVHYWRKPTILVASGNQTTDDAQVLDIGEDAARSIPYYVAGQIKLSEAEESVSKLLLGQYREKKASLVGNDIGYTGSVLNVYNMG